MKYSKLKKKIFYLTHLIFLMVYSIEAHALINIISAENFYGEVAHEIGGPYVQVTSILNNPNQDPHLFSVSANTLIMLAKADLIICNGANYDPWMQNLLIGQKNKQIMIVAELLKKTDKNNPHIWYIPETMLIYARDVTDRLAKLDPSHRLYFQAQLKKFIMSYQPIFTKIKNLQQNFEFTPISASEPIFNYMAKAIGLVVLDQGLQLSVMNDIPPTFSQMQELEDHLRQKTVKLFIYNNQVMNPAIQRILTLATSYGIPVVGISETMPNNITYVQWIMRELTDIEIALKNRPNAKNN